ncbi:hypothetical protein L9F63_000901, partial [Diploptera punctata]
KTVFLSTKLLQVSEKIVKLLPESVIDKHLFIVTLVIKLLENHCQYNQIFNNLLLISNTHLYSISLQEIYPNNPTSPTMVKPLKNNQKAYLFVCNGHIVISSSVLEIVIIVILSSKTSHFA